MRVYEGLFRFTKGKEAHIGRLYQLVETSLSHSVAEAECVQGRLRFIEAGLHEGGAVA